MNVHPFLLRLTLGTLLLTAGCSRIVDGRLGDPVTSCAAMPDGTTCASAEICVQERCIFSVCGDGFVDLERGEVCDDGNLASGDGCEPNTCRFTCELDSQCPANEQCTATGGCDLTTHTCNPPVGTSGGACTRPDDSEGVCNRGFCPPDGCGNGELDPGEECDEDSPGCAPDCMFTCSALRPCTTANVCTTPVECDLETHTCVELEPLDCDDGDACTADGCDRLTGCANVLVDADGDGYSPASCAPGSVYQGGDCNDADPTIRPGAPEFIDGIDQNCNGIIDENPGVECMQDLDRDGYGNPSALMYVETACPAGWVAPRPHNDCHDGNADVNPGHTVPMTAPYCRTGTLRGSQASGFACSDDSTPSWDWNCDQNVLRAYTTALECSILSCTGAGWEGETPDCGEAGVYKVCPANCLLCSCSSATESTSITRQGCL